MIDLEFTEKVSWRAVRFEQLDEALTGATITGAELIDLPVPDGVLIYYTDKAGVKKVLEISVSELDGLIKLAEGVPNRD